MKKLILCFGLLLTACASSHLSNENRQKIDSVALVSLMDSEFYLDAIGASVLRSKEAHFNFANLHLNEVLSEKYKQAAESKGKHFSLITLPPSKTQSEYKKLSAAQLRDIAIQQADANGDKYVFLVNSIDKLSGFPIYRGPMGMVCVDRKLKKTNASTYFLYQVDLWEVKTKKHLFHTTINPTITDQLAAVKCADLKDISEVSFLEKYSDNVLKALDRTVQFTFSELDW